MKRTDPVVASERIYSYSVESKKAVSEFYGEDTFNSREMEKRLPKSIYEKFHDIREKGKNFDLETANAVAHAMKEWAIEKGATHYSHWFQPMTGSTAEKHDAFIEFTDSGKIIERFTGKQLVQGEPDASSFPSGGIRSTFEARGYTVWDPSSPAFIIKSGKGTTLSIPSLFLSYTGEALDNKTPLLRSIRAINESALRVMKILGNKKCKKVSATLGPEQEYFLIDKDYYSKRPDIVMTKRTLIGATPAKGQQLEDHYFGSIKERILSYMHEVDEELYKLGIPAKTRHNEVAPGQYEIAPIFEEANIAVDHNQLVMETLRKIALRHDLVVLLHEKPFEGINGSGKHLNWSLSDDAGNNLLNPGKTPQDNIQFLVFLLATVRAVYLHADILRASVASSGNDHRLGANEAPPAVISVFIGEQLSRILEDIEKGAVTEVTNEAIIDLGISNLPVLSRDNTDRNRTSPFAFTGNKFEFRAVGSQQTISFPAMVLNTIVAESLDDIADMIENSSSKPKQAVLEVIQEEISRVKPVLFAGDNYSREWEDEAERRGLPNRKNLPSSVTDMISDKTVKMFEKYRVLSEVELHSRYHIRIERYCTKLDIESLALHNMISNQVLPAAINYQREFAGSIHFAKRMLDDSHDVSLQEEMLMDLSSLISRLLQMRKELKNRREEAISINNFQEQAEYFAREIIPVMTEAREISDSLELLVSDDLWPVPKYWEILFIG